MVNNFILIVDDEKAILSTLELALGDIAGAYNYSIKTFSDPDDCLKFFNSNEGSKYCRLVISDVDMPGMNGLELQEAILKWGGKDIPYIFMTAGDTERLTKSGVEKDRIMSKPFDLMDLICKVERYAKDR